MNNETDSRDQPRQGDWISSVILVAIWFLGLFIISETRPGIPKSMLAIGTVFFILLIPAMKELVRTIERFSGRKSNRDKPPAGSARRNADARNRVDRS